MMPADSVAPAVVASNRRHFLRQVTGAGAAFCLELGAPLAAHAAPDARAGNASAAAVRGKDGDEVTAWVLIQPDDIVVLRVARSEMGQGSETALAMLIAEELECNWHQVRVEFASVTEHLRRNRVWGSMSTGGSRSIRDSQGYLRQAGAAARTMLVTAAAQTWQVEPASCRAALGLVLHEASGRSLRYGELAAAAARLPIPTDVPLKDPKNWTLLGTPVKRVDLRDKVLGKPVFGIDVQVPGMLHASIAQCPVFGGTLASVDGVDAAAKMRGVKRVIKLDNAVAVVADTWWRADRALAQLKPQWNAAGNGEVSSASIMAYLKAGHGEDVQPAIARNDGDAPATLAQAARVLEGEYFTPYLAHATMEPQNATAWFDHDRLRVWAPTQNGEASAAAASEAGGVPLASVDLYKTMLGCGLGRRGANQDFVRYAVLIARELPGVPVKTTWSRTEDMQHDFYRPISLTRMKAGLDANGRLVAWQTRLASSSIVGFLSPERIKNNLDEQACGSFIDSPYEVPHQRVEFVMRNTHVPVGYWRSVYHSQNPFFRECFLDEIAAATGQDPLALRRGLLGGPKARRDRAILETVAKAAGWDDGPKPGISRGIAVVDGYGSFTAAVFEIAVRPGKDGDKDVHLVEIKRVVVGIDSGYVANPNSARAQMEGAVIYGLTAAFLGENTLEAGRIKETNFTDYPMMHLRDTPPVIQTILAPTGGFWGGFGEPGAASLTPALCNAIYAATGERIRSLPLKNSGYRLATSA
jgi:isoquinoline 1-oxidoreductase beta subunit